MKTKSNIVIKVLSLGIGLAVGIVLIAKVFFEPSYDSFYKDIDRPILAGDPVKVLSKWGSVMVTHSQKDAAQAQRTIDLFDGQIVSDVKNEL